MTVFAQRYVAMWGWQLIAGVMASYLYGDWGVGILVVSVLMSLHVSRRIGSEE